MHYWRDSQVSISRERLVLRIAVPFLEPTGELVALAFDHIKVVVGQLAPLLLRLAFELLLVALVTIPVPRCLLSMRNARVTGNQRLNVRSVQEFRREPVLRGRTCSAALICEGTARAMSRTLLGRNPESRRQRASCFAGKRHAGETPLCIGIVRAKQCSPHRNPRLRGSRFPPPTGDNRACRKQNQRNHDEREPQRGSGPRQPRSG